MTARRARLVAAVVMAMSALAVGPAHAAGTARITSPSSGATLGSPTTITIQVTGDNGSVFRPEDHQVLVRLADHTGAAAYPGTRTVAATCRTDCHTDSTWTVASFDPATLSPFAAGPSCNGGYTVQAQVDGGPWTGNAVHVGRAPGAARDVRVTGGVGEATVEWSPAPDPDVVGYSVDRRRDGGAWRQVASVPPGARSVTDDDVAAGEVEYRVVTLRGDGLVAGRPAAPCTDDAPDLATPSVPVSATVRSASSAPSPSPSPSDDPTAPSRPSPSPSDSPSDGGGTGGSGGSDGDGGTTGGTADGGDDDGTATPGDDEAAGDGDGSGTDGSTDDGTATPTRRPGNRVAPPSRVDTMAAPGVDVPNTPAADGPQVASEEERFYGEGQAFSEELEYGDLGEVDALGEGPETTRVVRVPGALQSVLGEELALDRILAPVAAGMILLAFGLHLRRWTREGLEG